jgi:hypothetical protein
MQFKPPAKSSFANIYTCALVVALLPSSHLTTKTICLTTSPFKKILYRTIFTHAMVAGHRTLLLLLAAALLAAVAAVAAAEDAKPTILTPVAQTPVGSFEGDKPGADDAMDDDDAAPVGAPIGTTMTEPKPELTTPPGVAGDATPAASAAASLAAVARFSGAAVVAAAGVLAF